MPHIRIQVECYAGAKADETPLRFRWEERLIEVGEVLDRRRQVESGPQPRRADYFRVRGADRREYLLRHDVDSDDWLLVEAALQTKSPR